MPKRVEKSQNRQIKVGIKALQKFLVGQARTKAQQARIFNQTKI